MNVDWASPESSPHALLKQISRKPNLATIKIIIRFITQWCLRKLSKIP